MNRKKILCLFGFFFFFLKFEYSKWYAVDMNRSRIYLKFLMYRKALFTVIVSISLKKKNLDQMAKLALAEPNELKRFKNKKHVSYQSLF